MGYYTRYTMSIDRDTDADYNEFEKQKEALLVDESVYWRKIWGQVIETSYFDGMKWYSHDDEMIELSKKYPLVLITLEGEGEESKDMWKKYYLNGKRQHTKARIIFDGFDKKKLK